MPGILIAVILLIVYGSLYPWRFEWRELPHSPLWVLLHSWSDAMNRRIEADIVINVALYVPLGMAAFAAFRGKVPEMTAFRGKVRNAFPALLLSLALGTALSASIEMLQLYTPGRICSAVDLADNVLGTALGVGAAILLERSGGAGALQPRLRVADRPALAVLLCRVASYLFPFFPALSLHGMPHRLRILMGPPLFAPVTWISGAAGFFATGLLLDALGVARKRAVLMASLLLIPAQFFILTRWPRPAELIGAFMGALLFWRYADSSARILKFAGGAFLIVLAVRGLSPFHFGPPTPLDWVPFGPLLRTEWQPGVRILLEKASWYGIAIWLLWAGGMRWRKATLAVAATLLAIELGQTRVPGRTPEITDPLMALLIGAGLAVLQPKQRPVACISPFVRLR